MILQESKSDRITSDSEYSELRVPSFRRMIPFVRNSVLL